jgi:ankyrin repeat protein/L-ascorbate metabolism protein UlaG (beta-lactamase superfamily)
MGLIVLLVLGSLGPVAAAAAAEIHDAVHAGDAARVAALLALDPAQVHVPEDVGCANLPLHIAAIDGNVEIARLLLDAGARVDGGDCDESTPLDVAAMHCHPEMVRFLLLRGADVNRRDRNGAYALSFAVSGADSTVIQTVLDAGADLNHRGRDGATLLHVAIARNLDGLIDRLLARGFGLEAPTEGGDTPLHWAAVRERLDVVERLLAAGVAADPANDSGWTPLMNAARTGRLEIAERLIEAGAAVNAVSESGDTPLLACSWDGHAAVGSLLVARGARVDEANARGQTALLKAATRGYTELARALLGAGADARLIDPDHGQTALHRAAVTGRAEIAELLIAHGASLTRVDADGASPLDLARRYGNADVAGVLVAHGAPGPVDDGPSPGSLAAQPPLAEGEAVLWYLGHSGYAIKTSRHLLIFDDCEHGNPPGRPGLANGHIDPTEIAGERVVVFASHAHTDHYDPIIFSWREVVPDIRYAMGFEPEGASPDTYIPPRETRELDELRITTIESNDSGVGFMVEVDGLVIFHAGDHANRWQDFSGPYTAEIDWLREAGFRPDIALLPSTGCRFRDQVAVKMGIRYALAALEPRVFIPIHGGDASWQYVEVIEACRDSAPDVRMVAPVDRGDHFHYVDHTIDGGMSRL